MQYHDQLLNGEEKLQHAYSYENRYVLEPKTRRHVHEKMTLRSARNLFTTLATRPSDQDEWWARTFPGPPLILVIDPPVTHRMTKRDSTLTRTNELVSISWLQFFTAAFFLGVKCFLYVHLTLTDNKRTSVSHIGFLDIST